MIAYGSRRMHAVMCDAMVAPYLAKCVPNLQGSAIEVQKKGRFKESPLLAERMVSCLMY